MKKSYSISLKRQQVSSSRNYGVVISELVSVFIIRAACELICVMKATLWGNILPIFIV